MAINEVDVDLDAVGAEIKRFADGAKGVLGLVPAGANPLAPNVVGGSANITGLGTSSVIVTQTSPRTVIDWRSFNISAGEITRFVTRPCHARRR